VQGKLVYRGERDAEPVTRLRRNRFVVPHLQHQHMDISVLGACPCPSLMHIQLLGYPVQALTNKERCTRPRNSMDELDIEHSHTELAADWLFEVYAPCFTRVSLIEAGASVCNCQPVGTQPPPTQPTLQGFRPTQLTLNMHPKPTPVISNLHRLNDSQLQWRGSTTCNAVFLGMFTR
jgi:hypothetical protein